jgi:hypothetical protein
MLNASGITMHAATRIARLFGEHAFYLIFRVNRHSIRLYGKGRCGGLYGGM